LQARLGGSNVALTLVPRLQSAAERAVTEAGKTASIVAIAADSGDVLALYSVPGERGDPLLVAQLPASTFKPLVAFAALEAGALDASTVKECTGSYDFEGKHFTCTGKHGSLNVEKALAASCNAFFYDLATAVAPERVRDVARRFGYGERTGIELADEAGQVPESEETPRTLRVLDAIGHGNYRITLLQLARAYAAIANGGKLPSLSLIRGQRASRAQRTLELSASHLAIVHQGLLDAVSADYGRAHAFAIPGLAFAGKTGGAEAPPLKDATPAAEQDEDGWFVAYAPASKSQIVVAARVERRGSVVPAALVKTVLEAWRDSQ
jgi:penicillin-binding protein 2